MDYYPYHLARGDRRHWVRYSDAAPHRSWLHANLAAFDTRLLDILLSGSVTFQLMARRGSYGAAWLLWCGVALMVLRGSYGAAWILWCGVAQLVARPLAVRLARVRFLARHHREVFPTELTSGEEMERGPCECVGYVIKYGK
jgi:hypothetical protein